MVIDGMPFSLEDWLWILQRLERARLCVRGFREGSSAEAGLRRLLEDAIRELHAVAEYAINVQLELAGLKPERRHAMDKRAADLVALGKLNGGYSERLRQLEEYRKKAEYLGYVTNRSVHFSATNVEDCLVSIDELIAETKAALRAANKLGEE